jgi:hypothetical protein
MAKSAASSSSSKKKSPSKAGTTTRSKDATSKSTATKASTKVPRSSPVASSKETKKVPRSSPVASSRVNKETKTQPEWADKKTPPPASREGTSSATSTKSIARSTTSTALHSPGKKPTKVLSPSGKNKRGAVPFNDVEYDGDEMVVDHDEDITATLGVEAVAVDQERESKEHARQQQLVSVKAVVKKHIYPYVSLSVNPTAVLLVVVLQVLLSIHSLNSFSTSLNRWLFTTPTRNRTAPLLSCSNILPFRPI